MPSITKVCVKGEYWTTLGILAFWGEVGCWWVIKLKYIFKNAMVLILEIKSDTPNNIMAIKITPSPVQIMYAFGASMFLTPIVTNLRSSKMAVKLCAIFLWSETNCFLCPWRIVDKKVVIAKAVVFSLFVKWRSKFLRVVLIWLSIGVFCPFWWNFGNFFLRII